jgi:hypothetical protein
MKTRLFLASAAILAVTAVAGGCSDAPMAPAPEEAGLGAPARRDVSPDPLMVYMDCYYYGSPGSELLCQATASGGTGTGYTFYWSYNSHSGYTAGAYSSAWINCSAEWYGGPYHEQGAVTLQVVDSGGGFAEIYTGNYHCTSRVWYAGYSSPYY